MNRPVIKDITVEITNRCQLRCRACSIHRERERHEITASRFMKMMENWLDFYQLRYISLTGGEPFLHPGINGILKGLVWLRARGRINGIGIYSNGAATAAIIKVFQRQESLWEGIDLGISVDGDEKVHDALRGRGAYRRTLKTLEFLSSHYYPAINLELKFTINRVNYRCLDRVYKLARSLKARFSPKLMEYGVSSYYHRQALPSAAALSALTAPMRCVVRRQLIDLINGQAQGVDHVMLSMLVRLLDGGPAAISACLTPQNSVFITSRGDIYPCLYMDPVGRVGADGRLPTNMEPARKILSRTARSGECPRCLAYHGVMKRFNKPYLMQ